MKSNRVSFIFNIVLVLVLALNFVITPIFLISRNEASEQFYPLLTIVREVNPINDTVTVEDFNGNLWQFHGCEDWFENDFCNLVMRDNKTPYIYDDVIEDVKYDGWVEQWYHNRRTDIEQY